MTVVEDTEPGTPDTLQRLYDRIERGIRYQVIYADPPWRYRSTSPIAEARSNPATYRALCPDYYYDVLSFDDIKELPIRDLADRNSVCFLWVTTPLLPEGMEVLKAWGFRYVTTLTWVKTNGTGPGYWFRGFTEHILFGVRGRVKSFRSMIPNVLYHKRLRHSEKPHMFRQIIEEVTGSLSPRIELFARTHPDGWDVWGNEV